MANTIGCWGKGTGGWSRQTPGEVADGQENRGGDEDGEHDADDRPGQGGQGNGHVGHDEDLPGQSDEHFDRLLSIHTGPAHLDVPQAVQHQICLAVGDFRRDKLNKVHCFDKFHRQHLMNHICERVESKSGAWVSKG